ncbi:LysM peptidoglycan-binding domain-containing protein [Paenibacillus sp. P96]|uniref:LysM peptidoglycan-binding domain-containing protein n=1 Tax=Paenibacillus zeirhizosphaerae TaxID=2987519 RepID=A0ABT9FVH8_9BACL|nr:LysM peptidoglycan-binding domain-containing protein [Paenibacillus sp. P96]MDP4098615.1 LysM peptidoglycan-binding domain-containing protein [Paenibacillus sp. P96]
MLKYSTYQSIHNESAMQDEQADGRSLVPNRRSYISMHRLLVAVVVLWISFAGLLTVFAGPSDLHASGEKLIVLPGDTLWEIAKTHKPEQIDTRIYIEGIIRINGLDSSEIRAGEVLQLPEF